VIPFAVRIAIVVIGGLMFVASFVIRSSVDRGTRITRDVGPKLNTDIGVFAMRALGAFVISIGLLTWVINYTKETGKGIF